MIRHRITHDGVIERCRHHTLVWHINRLTDWQTDKQMDVVYWMLPDSTNSVVLQSSDLRHVNHIRFFTIRRAIAFRENKFECLNHFECENILYNAMSDPCHAPELPCYNLFFCSLAFGVRESIIYYGQFHSGGGPYDGGVADSLLAVWFGRLLCPTPPLLPATDEDGHCDESLAIYSSVG